MHVMRPPAVLGLLGCVPASGFVPVPSARFVGTTVVSLRMTAARDSDHKSPWDAFATDMAKNVAVAATAVAVAAFSAPGDALAAGSGGIIGGGSFSSPSSVSQFFQLRHQSVYVV